MLRVQHRHKSHVCLGLHRLQQCMQTRLILTCQIKLNRDRQLPRQRLATRLHYLLGIGNALLAEIDTQRQRTQQCWQNTQPHHPCTQTQVCHGL